MRAARGDVRDAVVVDEEIMTHVFHAYATYKVPFVRGSTVLLDKAQPSDRPRHPRPPKYALKLAVPS